MPDFINAGALLSPVLATISYPEIDPVALELGPLVIRWYSLAYIAGLLFAWWYCKRLCFQPPRQLRPVAIDDFMMWATIGVIAGGRMGYVLFYNPSHFLSNPLDIFLVWQGGMSFHGGLLGVITAMFLFARTHKVSFLTVGDIVACATPVGLFFGRMANFINGELYGRVTDASVGMIFPNGGPEPRHPSQLYEGATEGLALFLLLFVVSRMGGLKRRGLLSGLFLIGYGLARSSMEQFREPDGLADMILFEITTGQLLSLPMIAVGTAITFWALRQPEQPTGPDFKPEDISDKARREKEQGQKS
ncbi:prolipoprotein diacylglyceryl transferase [Kiloniella sp. b19]|uniref:prolipoprotein diacylglyceryl transferase n=1 Tax=Kiloniella sp. GXU_MW_B19 TaxID=3141326 RepID=UPI0031D5BADF